MSDEQEVMGAVERLEAMAVKADREADFHRLGGLIPGSGSPVGRDLRLILSHLATVTRERDASFKHHRETTADMFAKLALAEAQRDEAVGALSEIEHGESYEICRSIAASTLSHIKSGGGAERLGPCPTCGGQTWAKVDEREPGGGFASSDQRRRCVECKAVYDRDWLSCRLRPTPTQEPDR